MLREWSDKERQPLSWTERALVAISAIGMATSLAGLAMRLISLIG